MKQVALTAQAMEQFSDLPRSIQPRINNVILRLAQWPNISGTKALTGNLAGNYRIRTGDYRIVFKVTAEKIIIWKIANRKDVYLD